MKNKLIYFLSALVLLVLSCEEEVREPLVKSNSTPQPPFNIQVENLPGAAKISYNLPDSPDLLYVMAEFSDGSGHEKTVKSSVFKNYLLLEGFGRAGEYSITLYAVNRSENYSEPVDVKINPLQAPVHDVFASLKAHSTFGGVNMTFVNELENEYTVYTLVKDTVSGNWTEYDRLYTSMREQNYSVRGFLPIPTDFAFFFMDRWKNKSDTLFANLTPLYEVEFDKTLWADADLPDDSNEPRYKPLYQLWTPGATTYFFMSQDMVGLTLPNWVTIDLGKKYVFGRMHVDLTNHHNNWIYTQGTPKQFEIWGANTKTTNWDEWTMLGEFEIVKPSGLPVGQLSAEDIEQAGAGHDFDFPFQSEAFRYIRFKTVTTFGGRPDVNFREITLWGQPVE
ncbi:protein of unknown function [Mariniphaga anaerophila]|uniref:F5/8 type C domain-containing protein n=1 Tax=Mariniphaga anaerophila TaxID=1484053 RepID=A0A1M5FA33_9BACT|nr:DUF5000 domain-containing lipoprotein [Mariniphaga anaerophila]SHF87962.1 protein of unknown function [Mariniphaga anaerophila]